MRQNTYSLKSIVQKLLLIVILICGIFWGQEPFTSIIIFLLLLFCLLHLGKNISNKYNDQDIVYILIVAFLARIFLAFLTSFCQILPSLYTSDPSGYNQLAVKLVEGWRAAYNPSIKLSFGVKYYVWLMASIYFFTGNSPLVVKLLNSFLGVLIVYNIFRITLTLSDIKAAKIAAGITALYPSLIFFSSQNFRDSIIILSLLQIIYASIFWFRTSKLKYILIMMLFTVLMGLFRPYMATISISCILLTSIYKICKIKNQLKPIFIIIVLITIGMFLYVTKDNIFISRMGHLSPRILANLRRGQAKGNSAVFRYIPSSSWLDIMEFLPLGIFYFLFAPFPWEFSNMFQMISSAENIILYLICFISIMGLKRNYHRIKKDCLFMFLFVFLTIVLYGIVSGNIGTGYRHKLQVIWVFFIFAGMYIGELFGKKLLK